MQRIMILQLVAAFLLLYTPSAMAVDDSDAGRILPQLSFYHRFSAQLKERAQREGKDWAFPAPNSPEYHKYLVGRDFARHGRRLAAAPGAFTFAEGNISLNLGLQFSVVDIGTPAVSHFVALDTGSDLFWLPCECISCATINVTEYPGLPLDVYTPSNSTTSKSVTCSSSDCSSSFSTCNGPSNGQCSYGVKYGSSSSNTSTSGIVFQDVLHLTANGGAATNVTTPILLGCGRVQSGQLQNDTNVLNGLMGLGPESYSVPSMLAHSGLVGNSFSMCFDLDGTGRVVFGDFGSNLSTTPFQPRTPNAAYFLGLTSITVGTDSIPVSEPSLFDTGTTVTFLTTTVYNAVLNAFEKQVTYTRGVIDDGTFDLCYEYQSSKTGPVVPKISFELSGAASFEILSALFFYVNSNGDVVAFCLGLADGGTTNIFGVNFMFGYNLVFNLQDSTLGFEQADCYKTVSSSIAPSLSPGVSPILAPAPSPSSGSPTPSSQPPVIVPTTPSPGTTPSAPSPGSAPRTSVSLLSFFSLGLLVHFLLL